MALCSYRVACRRDRFFRGIEASEVYRELEGERGTYHIAHFRRMDTAKEGYKGGHAMVSKRSYLEAFAEFGGDQDRVVWVSDEKEIGWKWLGPRPVNGGMKIPCAIAKVAAARG